MIDHDRSCTPPQPEQMRGWAHAPLRRTSPRAQLRDPFCMRCLRFYASALGSTCGGDTCLYYWVTTCDNGISNTTVPGTYRCGGARGSWGICHGGVRAPHAVG